MEEKLGETNDACLCRMIDADKPKARFREIPFLLSVCLCVENAGILVMATRGEGKQDRVSSIII